MHNDGDIPAGTRIRRLGASLGSFVGSLALVCVPYVLSSAPIAAAAPPVAEVRATVSEWSVTPELLHIPANTPVSLVFEDQSDLAHELAVPDLHVDVVIRPGEQATAVVASAPVGVYRWTCVLPEHQAAGMQGWVVVGGTLGEHLQHAAAS